MNHGIIARITERLLRTRFHLEKYAHMVYLTLFGSAFLAATLLPFYSEAILVAYLQQGYAAFALWLAATLGNTLGACLNWVLGRYFLHYQDRKWFPIKAAKLKKAQQSFQKYGQWSLLFSWLPVVGDALTLLAGVLRVNFLLFFVLTFIGKGARYLVVLGVTLQFI